jgi:DNA (cytosine-5)-methyltransferase 1
METAGTSRGHTKPSGGGEPRPRARQGADMTRPRLLDLYCGAGGAAVGYHRAGFDVVGVDTAEQPNYPYEFHQADALDVLRDSAWVARNYDVIHASPPCQAYSSATKRWPGRRDDHADLVAQTRALLNATGLPYVIENVVGAPLLNPIMLCGSSFGLGVERHRLFETNWPLMAAPCAHYLQPPRYETYDARGRGRARSVPVYGQGRRVRSVDGVPITPDEDRQLRAGAMGIDWMTDLELSQAIPPAYTEFIGRALLDQLGMVRGGGAA